MIILPLVCMEPKLPLALTEAFVLARQPGVENGNIMPKASAKRELTVFLCIHKRERKNKY